MREKDVKEFLQKARSSILNYWIDGTYRHLQGYDRPLYQNLDLESFWSDLDHSGRKEKRKQFQLACESLHITPGPKDSGDWIEITGDKVHALADLLLEAMEGET